MFALVFAPQGMPGRAPAPRLPWSPAVDAPQQAAAPRPAPNRPVFYVQKVIGRRQVGGRVQFKVRWQGFGPQADTWEPRSGLPTDPETRLQVQGLDAAAREQAAAEAAAAARDADQRARQWFEEWLELLRSTVAMCVRQSMARTKDRTVLRSVGQIKIRHTTTGAFVCPVHVFAMLAGAARQALFDTALDFSTQLEVPLNGALAYRPRGREKASITIPAPQAKFVGWGEAGHRTVYVICKEPRNRLLVFSPAKGFAISRRAEITAFVPIKMWLRRSKTGRRPICVEVSACVFDEGYYEELVERLNL